MKTITVRIPEGLEARLQAAARKRHQSRSMLIRGALEAFLDGCRQGPTALDLAGHAVGRLEGPRDLSMNREYMDDFGR